jgi:hypothetical protein
MEVVVTMEVAAVPLLALPLTVQTLLTPVTVLLHLLEVVMAVTENRVAMVMGLPDQNPAVEAVEYFLEVPILELAAQEHADK